LEGEGPRPVGNKRRGETRWHSGCFSKWERKWGVGRREGGQSEIGGHYKEIGFRKRFSPWCYALSRVREGGALRRAPNEDTRTQ